MIGRLIPKNLNMDFVFLYFKQINQRSFGSWCIKEPKNPLPERVDSSVPLMHHDLREFGLTGLVKKHKISFQILSDLRIQPGP